MSIESLCTGDQVRVIEFTHALGASGGDVLTPSDGDLLDCLVQSNDGSSLSNDARGQRSDFTLFFSSDPAITVDNQLKWIVQAGVELGTPIEMRVMAIDSEGRPGETMLWMAQCEHVTTRKEN